jgi:peptide/nickel transport system substrate-binding protein
MKKFILIPIAIILVGVLILGGCAKEEAIPTASPTASPTSSPTASPTSSPTASPTSSPTASPTASPTSTAGQPVYGGTLKCVSASIPNVIGYAPEKAPGDNYMMLPVIERLCEWDKQGNQIPVLAESWEGDPDAMTITWHLRKGVKFSDGTDWNAEALRWNFQLSLDAGRLTDGQYVESLEVVDDHTLVMHLTNFTWLMFENYGWVASVSPTAFMNSGATDEERINWARANAVGTGAFVVDEWKRDNYIRFAKNPNYWRQGMPYLDGIEIRLISDPMVASASIEAGEADMWFDCQTVENIVDLQAKGYNMNWGPGYFQALLFNSNDPDSIFYDKKIREAFEYAIDRPALAQMIGQGIYEPLTQMASSTWPGYVEGYDPRPYNPEKAIELLEQAGYPGGFQTTMLSVSDYQDIMAALQSFLGEVGIIIEPDMADWGRFGASLFGTGWKDTAYAGSGINPDATDLFIHYGPTPMTFRTGNIWKSDAYLALCNEALDPKYQSAAEAMPKIKEAIRQAGEDCMLVPLFRAANTYIMQDYVHSDYGQIHGVIWTSYDDWMEEH